MNAGSQALELEIAALRERLEEAEDMRRAIVQGEVDAFVVGPRDEDKKVLLLAGAYSRYRQLIDEMEHGTVSVGRRGEILFANRRFAAILGAALGELHGHPLADYLHPDDRTALAALLAGAHDGEEGLSVRLARPGGGHGSARITRASSWEGCATFVVVDLAQDEAAAEARQTLEAIRRGEVDAFVMGETVITLTGARDPYQVLADRIQQGALTLSPQGRIVYANARLVRLLGVPPERLLGTPLEAYLPAADRPALARLLAARNGHTAQAEVRLHRTDGRALQVLVSVAALADGQTMCLLTDVSESRRHQASDERTRKFLAMLAHEFRNMLNGMRLSMELVKREPLGADGIRAVESLERQMHRMLQVVEDLRTINPKD
ncbi:MAG TPA: PAS domain-containing protein [Myxococcota bacterium]|nr:PAS domain-containing protein [Myxococcota bacterium]